ncbi:MAG: hypothetical protein ABIW50_09415 [Candidatus Limnocylindria bacterium]
MTATRAAWVAFALTVAAMLAAMVTWAVGVDEPFTPDIALYPVVYLCLAVVGALIVTRQPGNVVGRLCLLAGLLGSIAALGDSYARLATPAPAQEWATLISASAFPATFGPIVGILLLFPNGRLASSRWAPIAWLVAIGVGFVAIGSALSPTFADFPMVRNPIGVSWLTGSIVDQGGVGWILLLLGTVSATAGLVVRFWGAQGIERQQLKLATFAASLNGLSWLFVALNLPGAIGEVAKYAVFATLATIPIAIGVAMLRYRLYDFDLIIRRTLVYGALTLGLGAAYVGLVLALHALLRPVTGNNALAVALSTLAIAALFGPARRQTQRTVDRRFYRSRYDAQRTLQVFNTRLREELDLAHLTDELRGVVGETLQPASVGVWLREGGVR